MEQKQNMLFFLGGFRNSTEDNCNFVKLAPADRQDYRLADTRRPEWQAILDPVEFTK